jgi:hypothetical protein
MQRTEEQENYAEPVRNFVSSYISGKVLCPDMTTIYLLYMPVN